MIPRIAAINLLYFYFVLSWKTKTESNFQQVGALVTKNISFFVHSESRPISKTCRIQKTFLKGFSYMLFLLIL